MRYAVISASYSGGSLAVTYAGLDHERLNSLTAAEKKAGATLLNELAANTLPDIHQLLDNVMQALTAAQPDLHQLDNWGDQGLSISWLADDHFIIAVMDQTETYQLHIEVVPI